MFENEIRGIDGSMGSDTPPNIPELFSRVPLDDFGSLLMNIPPPCPNVKSFFFDSFRTASEKLDPYPRGSVHLLFYVYIPGQLPTSLFTGFKSALLALK